MRRQPDAAGAAAQRGVRQRRADVPRATSSRSCSSASCAGRSAGSTRSCRRGTTPKMIEKESAHPPHRLRGDADRGAGRRGGPDRRRVRCRRTSTTTSTSPSTRRRSGRQQARTRSTSEYGATPPEAKDPLHADGRRSSVSHLDLGKVEEKVGGESLRGRTGGAVTLAVGMSVIFEQAFALGRRHRRLAAEVLVPLRDHVRGAVHPHHHRRRHAHRAVPAAGDRGPGVRAVRPAGLAARGAARQRASSPPAGAG